MSYHKKAFFDCLLHINLLEMSLTFTVQFIYLRFSEIACYDARILMLSTTNFIPL